MSAAELEAALQQFFSPSTSNAEKAKIEAGLQQVRESADAITLGCELLDGARSEYLLWFACSVLEHAVQRRWQAAAGKQDQVRDFLMRYLVERAGAGPKMVPAKVSKVLVDIARQDWPERYPDYLDLVKKACRDEASRPVGLRLLLTTVEEFASESSKALVSTKRKQHVRHLLRQELPELLRIVDATLQAGLQRADALSSGAEDPALSLAFQVLLQFMAWVPISQSCSASTMEALFKYMRMFKSPHAVEALSCINELLEKNFMPKDVQDFVGKVSLSALDTLRELAGSPALLEASAEDFVQQYTRFLVVFITRHLRKVEANGHFPSEAFMELLAKYTLLQPSPDAFLHTLDAWSVFVAIVNESDPSPATEGYVRGLCAFMMRLVDRVQWSASADALDMLDDEQPEQREPARHADESAAIQRLAERRTETELQRYVDRLLSFMATVASLPHPAAAPGLLPLLLDLCKRLDDSAGPALAAASGQNSDAAARAVTDVGTLLALAGKVAPCLAVRERSKELAPAAEKLIGWSVHIAHACVKDRLFTRGQHFVLLHVHALGLLEACSPFLHLLGSFAEAVYAPVALGAADQQLYADLRHLVDSFPGAMSQAVELALQSLDAQITPPPELVCVAAIQLLHATGAKVMPRSFFDLPAIKVLTQKLPMVATGLPLDARCLLYVALSQAITAPCGKQGKSHPEYEQRQRFHSELIGAEGRQLVVLVRESVAAGGRGSERCRAHLSVLSDLAHSAASAPTASKETVAPAVLDALPAALELIGVLLAPEQFQAGDAQRALAASLATAREALDFVVTVLRAFSRQVGQERCRETVNKLVGLFSQHATTQALARSSGGGGVLLLYKLLRLLATLMDEPTAFFKGLLPQILALCFDELPQVLNYLIEHEKTRSADVASGRELPGSVLDLLEVQYDLLHRVLRQHWRSYFFARAAGADNANTISGGANKTTVFASPESQRYFVRAMELLLESFQKPGMPPSLLRRNLGVFQDLQAAHCLYEQDDFRKSMRPAFIGSLLTLIVSKSHQILEEELLGTVYGLAAIDFEHFYAQLLPDIVRSFVRNSRGVELPDATVAEIVASVPHDTDLPSFTRSFHAFANDLGFFAATFNPQQ